MIERIEIGKCASYGDTLEVLDNLSLFNFVYGPNASGKTTISRIIKDGASYPTCTVRWRSGTTLQPLVYNRDFVEANFNQSAQLKGIFTLGEKNIDALRQIEDTKREIDELHEKIENLSQTLGGVDGTSGKKGDLNATEEEFKEACWNLKKKHDPKLQGAFTGYRGDAEKFKEKLLEKCENNSCELLTQSDLEKRAETVFGPTPAAESTLVQLDDAPILQQETNPVLQKRVLGNADVDIAGMIQKLGNSDWVRQGVKYFEMNDGRCPFCQQAAPHDLVTSLAEYFDDAFQKDSDAIATLKADYQSRGEHLQQALQAAIASASKFIDGDALKTEKALFDVRYQANLQRIESKRKEPSQIIELGSSADVLGAAKKLIDEANAKINAQNTLVENLKTEKQALTEQVWKFLADVEIKVDLANYKKKKADIEAGIQALDRKIDEARADKLAKEDHLKQLEKSTTSIQPTVNAINQLLAGFGFRTFSLATTSDGKYYVIRRPDGSDARATLSEGEFSFISFLYFYHLLKGSDSSAGITIDRVVVFDDPVSSLDSDILFVVGSLIKSLFEDVRQNKGTIKQIFVLTHNVYFHKEVTFNPRRNNGALNEETFWTVSKLQDVSRITRHSDNPIKTSYDLLWNEVRNPNLSSQSLQNTLRRILESYFRILGNMDSDAICEKFDGSEKVICRSLFSWVNDGSHSDHDDLYISADGGANEAYLSVFRKIFDKLGHLNHYKMMMGSFYAEPPAAAAAAKSDPASVATPDKVPLGEGTLPGEAAAAAH